MICHYNVVHRCIITYGLSAYSAPGTGQIHKNYIECKGNETSLVDCLDYPCMAVTIHQMWELSAIHKVYDMCMEMAVSA